eukprot:366142-Chlamydomonas_euryale.AAC.8
MLSRHTRTHCEGGGGRWGASGHGKGEKGGLLTGPGAGAGGPLSRQTRDIAAGRLCGGGVFGVGKKGRGAHGSHEEGMGLHGEDMGLHGEGMGLRGQGVGRIVRALAAWAKHGPSIKSNAWA